MRTHLKKVNLHVFIFINVIFFTPLSAQDNVKIKIDELITANVLSPGSFSGSVLVAQNDKIIYRAVLVLRILKKESKTKLIRSISSDP